MGDPIDIGIDTYGDPRSDSRSPWPTYTQDVTVWNVELDTTTNAACRIAGRNLTRTEWQTDIDNLASYHATCPDYPRPEG